MVAAKIENQPPMHITPCIKPGMGGTRVQIPAQTTKTKS